MACRLRAPLPIAVTSLAQFLIVGMGHAVYAQCPADPVALCLEPGLAGFLRKRGREREEVGQRHSDQTSTIALTEICCETPRKRVGLIRPAKLQAQRMLRRSSSPTQEPATLGIRRFSGLTLHQLSTATLLRLCLSLPAVPRVLQSLSSKRRCKARQGQLSQTSAQKTSR